MHRRIVWLAFALVLSLAVASPAAAAAPATGTVHEGQSVPGLALGDTRAVADASFGSPERCEDLGWGGGQIGLDASCRYPVDGGGTVTVYFQSADGGPPQAAPEDVVS